MQEFVRRAIQRRATSKQRQLLENRAQNVVAMRSRQRTRREHDSTVKLKFKRNYHHSLEDWKLGALAPNRNFGENAPSYGTLLRQIANPPNLGSAPPLSKLLQGREEISRCLYRPDDRVVILRGPERGKIGRVLTVDDPSMTLKLTDLYKVYTTLSEDDAKWLKELDSPPEGQLAPMYIPQADVRLVATLKNGKEAIVDKMILERSKKPGMSGFARFIPGTMEAIDTPKNVVKKAKSNSDFNAPKSINMEPSDTFADQLDAVTWDVSLEEPPFPMGIIDELRNKYSNYRVRHDDEFIHKLVAADVKKELRVQVGKDMLRTPAKELFIQQRSAARAEVRKKRLSSESRTLLSTYMAQNLSASQQKKLLEKTVD